MNTRSPHKKNHPSDLAKSPLSLLTGAALLLPGLLAPAVALAADEDEVDFQYNHYQEGKREIWVDLTQTDEGLYPPGSIVKAPNILNPIEADTLHGSARIKLADRLRFSANFTQDTWAGATPIASAPVVTRNMHGRLARGSNTLVGASPLLHNTSDANSFMDLRGNFYDFKPGVWDPVTGIVSPNTPGVKNNRLTHTLVSASPETRQQGDFKLTYEWDRAAVDVGGGESVENDYDSRFGNLGLALDFNQKRTRVNLGLSYTNSDTHAVMDPMSWNFMGTDPYFMDADAQTDYGLNPLASEYFGYSPRSQGTIHQYNVPSGHTNAPMVYDKAILTGNRQDWAADLGLTQVVTKNTLLTASGGFTHSSGFLSNPYKAVYVFDLSPVAGQSMDQPVPISIGIGRMEMRPHERNQVSGKLGLHYYLEALDAGLQFNYSIAHDDWGIDAHTFEGDWVQPVGSGWTVSPHVRYYSQSAADFYAPYFTRVQVVDQDGNSVNSPYNKALPDYYSSDQRLSGFGALSGGVTVAKQFAKGISLQAGFDYYTHQGGLKLGGGGEQAFADFDSWNANAALKLNFGALGGGGAGDGDHRHRHGNHQLAPAGLMFDHALDTAGDMMAAYRYMRDTQAGGILYGSRAAGDAQVLQAGCGTLACVMLPTSMSMNMHMLELMYAPADWLTLMLMPQWTDMAMTMDHHGAPNFGHTHGGGPSGIRAHQSGGIGDTGLYALFKLFEQPGQQVVLSLGGTAPTGAVDLKNRRNGPTSEANGINPSELPLSYGLQLGSGSWDFKPSLSYSGAWQDFGWGAQATGTHRLDSRNAEGYVLGDSFQGSVWGAYRWTGWLSSTLRGVYSWQDRIRGEYPGTVESHGIHTPYPKAVGHTGPEDLTSNYGGQAVDLGLGVNVTIPSGAFAGHSLKFEWLQPVYTKANGYQLDRDYALTATWGVGF